MVTLNEINELRSKEQWDEILSLGREHLQNDSSSAFVLRAITQALEHKDQKDDEYEGSLLRLLELNDRVVETAQKLGHYYREKGENEEAVRHLQIALEAAAADRQYESLEALWLELSELAPNDLHFYLDIAGRLAGIKQKQRAAVLLQMLLPSCEERGDWEGQYQLLKQILEYTPKDNTLRELIVNALRKIYADSSHCDLVLAHTGIQRDRPLGEALEETELLMDFLPDSFVRHPDWGIGRVKDLDMTDKKVLINFQRKRNNLMDLKLAVNVVDRLAKDDFRVLSVIDLDKLQNLTNENPVELIKILLRSFSNSLSAKEIKEQLVPNVIPMRKWTSWWSAANSELRKDPYIAIEGGSGKRYTIRQQAASTEEELLKKFDETKVPHAKVDRIYEYLRSTKKDDIQASVIKHFSNKIHAIIPRRRSQSERVELWFTNEDLKDIVEGIQSVKTEILDESVKDMKRAIRILQRLRFKPHQLRFIKHFQQVYPDHWIGTFCDLLLEPNVLIRDELIKELVSADANEKIAGVVDTVLNDFRQYPFTFIWMAARSFAGKFTWLEGKIENYTLIDRLLLLVDNLTNQAKRREKDEALWLRKVAGDAREIIRRNHYSLFKENIIDAPDAVAQSIYRRAQTNEGIDSRTSSDLTTIVRARYPDLFETHVEEEDIIPEGLLCLKASLTVKKTLLRRLIEHDLPEVVQEIEIARQHGDLKENAEYHAAKDKQKLLAAQTGELQEALQIARVVEMDDVDASIVGFGTHFHVSPLGAESHEDYIMLGPWESDPEKGVLSYQAPFAQAFMGKTPGDKVEVELPLHTGRYEIISIESIPQERLSNIIKTIEEPFASLEPVTDE